VTDDTDRVSAWRALLTAQAGALRAIEEELARAGTIPLAWYDVLLELNAAPGRRLRMSGLADRVVLSRTRVSRVVDELVKEGLVARETDPDDRRSHFAVVTDAGRTQLRRAAPRYLEGIERHFTSLLTDDERSVIAMALGRVAAHHRGPSRG
jgi:DNA-binding MarR family transcriptional regulator